MLLTLRATGAILVLLSLLSLRLPDGARAQNGAAAQNATATTQRNTGAGPAPGGTIPAQNSRVFLDTISPASAPRGTLVTLWGRLPADAGRLCIRFEPAFKAGGAAGATPGASCSRTPGGFGIPLSATVHDTLSARFVIPPNARFGYYRVSVGVGDSEDGRVYAATPGSGYHVRNADSVHVRSLLPAVAYGDSAVEAYLDVQGLSPNADENELLLNGRLFPVCGSAPATGCVVTTADGNGQTLKLRWLKQKPNPMKGLVKVQVRVGDQVSREKAFVISMVRESTPTMLAVGLLALVVAVVLALLWPLTKMRNGAGSRRAALSTIAFLDRETNTYSLSKLQFYLWTAAALLGYAYLTISRSLVRGDITFSDVPGGLPSLLLITTGTSALAVGITGAKGSKGAGERHPSASDLVTTGGLVAPERLQFLVWTLVGVAAFVVLVLSTSPAEIEQLPSIPEGFLALMGISSVGYLGGKLARKPGPVIRRVEATSGSLTLRVDGSNLAPDALFRIDDKDVMSSMLSPTEHPGGRPTVVAAEEQPGFARTLLIKIDNPLKEWTRLPDPAGEDEGARTGAHSLTIVNPDGQRAVVSFTVTPRPAPAPAPTPDADAAVNPGSPVTGVEGGRSDESGGEAVEGSTAASSPSIPAGSDIAPPVAPAASETSVTVNVQTNPQATDPPGAGA